MSNSEKNQETELYLPLYCILELPIRESKNISESAKIYFGELAVLCTKRKFIPYTDNQLAKMKGVSSRTIKNWHDELEKEGFIFRISTNRLREGEQCKWKKTRKMYLTQHPENDKLKFCSDSAENCTSDDSAENCTISNKILENIKNNNSQPPEKVRIPSEVVVVVFQSLQKLKLPEDYKRTLSREHDQKKIDLLVKRVKRWKDRESDYRACNTILSRWELWDDTPTKVEQEASKVVRMEDIKSKAEVRREKALRIKEMVPDVEFSVKENLIEISKESRGKISYHVVGFADDVIDKYFKTIEKKYSLSI